MVINHHHHHMILDRICSLSSQQPSVCLSVCLFHQQPPSKHHRTVGASLDLHVPNANPKP